MLAVMLMIGPTASVGLSALVSVVLVMDTAFQ
jgi:hypothetical protein